MTYLLAVLIHGPACATQSQNNIPCDTILEVNYNPTKNNKAILNRNKKYFTLCQLPNLHSVKSDQIKNSVLPCPAVSQSQGFLPLVSSSCLKVHVLGRGERLFLTPSPPCTTASWQVELFSGTSFQNRSGHDCQCHRISVHKLSRVAGWLEAALFHKLRELWPST